MRKYYLIFSLLSNNASAVFKDTNGNLYSLYMPSDYSGYRKRLYYGYDAATSTYPTWVSDDLGYVSETFYDGVPLQTTDVSGNVINFTYDRFGRMETVQAPYEADQGTPWTIRFLFWDMTSHPADSLVIPWAQTLHYDTMNPGNHITTTTFADGLGRALQTKKRSVVYENGQTLLTNVVSGKVHHRHRQRPAALHHHRHHSSYHHSIRCPRQATRRVFPRR